jgi:hypothetical protein
MIDVKHPKCKRCKEKHPNFNKVGEAKGLYCKGCADPDMIDVKSRKCIKCKKRANYGNPGNVPNRCSKHIETNMVVNPTRICKHKKCKEYAIFGNETHEYCEEHRQENNISFLNTKCLKCNKIDIVIDGLCITFCQADIKYNYLKKYIKKKELRIYEFLKENYKVPDDYGVKVNYDCGNKNAEEKEFGYDYGTHKVYIEVDEKQHKNYCKLGEFNRMVNIYMNDGGIPIIFLRYNPDNYYINGKKQNVNQGEKEKQLIKWLKYYENIENIKYNLSVQYLYYNNINQNINYEINPYKIKEYICKICKSAFYIESVYKNHIQNNHKNNTMVK